MNLPLPRARNLASCRTRAQRTPLALTRLAIFRRRRVGRILGLNTLRKIPSFSFDVDPAYFSPRPNARRPCTAALFSFSKRYPRDRRQRVNVLTEFESRSRILRSEVFSTLRRAHTSVRAGAPSADIPAGPSSCPQRPFARGAATCGARSCPAGRARARGLLGSACAHPIAGNDLRQVSTPVR